MDISIIHYVCKPEGLRTVLSMALTGHNQMGIHSNIQYEGKGNLFMQPTYGYAGKQLRVSLNTKTSRKEALNPKVLREDLGGVGYGKLLYSELERNRSVRAK